MQPGGKREIHGAENWARNAVQFAGASRFTSLALVDGDVGLVSCAAAGGALQQMSRAQMNNRFMFPPRTQQTS